MVITNAMVILNVMLSSWTMLQFLQFLKSKQIAGEQLIKLMSLGLTEKEAENQIINGFLK